LSDEKKGATVVEKCPYCLQPISTTYHVFPSDWTVAMVREWWRRNRDSEIEEKPA
jgi:hypothetical protein